MSEHDPYAHVWDCDVPDCGGECAEHDDPSAYGCEETVYWPDFPPGYGPEDDDDEAATTCPQCGADTHTSTLACDLLTAERVIR